MDGQILMIAAHRARKRKPVARVAFSAIFRTLTGALLRQIFGNQVSGKLLRTFERGGVEPYGRVLKPSR
jgi:hypothetical protein